MPEPVCRKRDIGPKSAWFWSLALHHCRSLSPIPVKMMITMFPFPAALSTLLHHCASRQAGKELPSPFDRKERNGDPEREGDLGGVTALSNLKSPEPSQDAPPPPRSGSALPVTVLQNLFSQTSASLDVQSSALGFSPRFPPPHV